MPRTRELKPAFFQDEDLATMSRDHRILFAALWTLADREGRLEDRPAWIKLYSFPFDADVSADDINRMLTDLAAHAGRFIARYQANGKRYLLVQNFKKHQHIHPKEAPSNFPPIPEVPEKARELPGITGKAKGDPGIPPMPSEPSCTSKPTRDPPARDPGTTDTDDGTPAPLPDGPFLPTTPERLKCCLDRAMQKARPDRCPYSAGQWWDREAGTLLRDIGTSEEVALEVLRRVDLFVADDRMAPWTVKRFCAEYNGIGVARPVPFQQPQRPQAKY